MENIDREVRAMTRREVITKAIAGQLSWIQAAEVLAITPRQLRRIRRAIEQHGMEAVMDQHGGRTATANQGRDGRAAVPASSAISIRTFRCSTFANRSPSSTPMFMTRTSLTAPI